MRLDHILARTGAATSLRQAKKLIRGGFVRLCTRTETRGYRCAWPKQPKRQVDPETQYVKVNCWDLVPGSNRSSWRRQEDRSCREWSDE